MSIKINRAKNLVKHLPMQERAIWESIPQELVDRLTAGELADVAKALNAHWHKATAHTAAEIVAEGYVWSAKHNQLLDVVPPMDKSTVGKNVGIWHPAPPGLNFRPRQDP